jgi:hypothetical protein
MNIVNPILQVILGITHTRTLLRWGLSGLSSTGRSHYLSS